MHLKSVVRIYDKFGLIKIITNTISVSFSVLNPQDLSESVDFAVRWIWELSVPTFLSPIMTAFIELAFTPVPKTRATRRKWCANQIPLFQFLCYLYVLFFQLIIRNPLEVRLSYELSWDSTISWIQLCDYFSLIFFRISIFIICCFKVSSVLFFGLFAIIL